jgi:hypothetical protein
MAASPLWLVLALRAGSGLESETAAQLRTAAFVLVFFCAGLAWTPKPPQRGGQDKERF